MEYVVKAAGGNATAIAIINTPQDRAWYEQQGRQLMERHEHRGVEQAGFLNLDTQHLEMSGGEFCGNAARAAAMLIAQHTHNMEFDFTMSGYNGPVRAAVTILDDSSAIVACTFANLRASTSVRSVPLPNGNQGQLVDLGGIVHVLVPEQFGGDRAVYEPLHRQITQTLELTERAAVGVCWFQQNGNWVQLHPVVWVRGIDSFFYETACGSGSIAVGLATGKTDVIQPSGQTIKVVVAGNSIELLSTVEISYAG